MTPVIYADILFLYNFLINSVILAITARLINARIHIMKIALGAVLGGIYSVFMFFPVVRILYSFILKILILFGIFYLVFGGNSIHKVLKNFAVFMTVNLTLGGAVYALIFLTDFGVIVGSVVSGTEIYMNLSPLIIVSGIGLTYAILGFHYMARKRAVYEQSLIKRVKVEYKGKTLEINLFLDTGCRLCDPVNDRPVIIAEYKYIKILLSEEEVGIIENKADAGEAYSLGMRIIRMRTVNGENVVYGIIADRICIADFEIKNVTVALVEKRINENYNGIINPEILNENKNEELVL